jgi:DtxR family Mn-dependent transcriptional regulator
MLTENKEDYLTEILKLQEDKKKITGKLLSEILLISQASVSEMMKKLKEEGLVHKDNTLTKKGL